MSAHNEIIELKKRISQSIIGQTLVVERLLLTLLCNGNVLVEGLPGLAKTRAVKSLAKNLEVDFSRIQFTPDLLPSDITVSEISLERKPRSGLYFSRVRSLQTSSWPTRSTGPQPRFMPHPDTSFDLSSDPDLGNRAGLG